jgi:2-polyprenyl-3-methyl-5-hydroxy-6-metoxy-1,4-benzoquinol methylase
MTNDFYEKNAQRFFENTVNVDVAELYEPFISRLQRGARVLDAGCGSGRDSLAFLKMGYRVDAFDSSAEMTRLAACLTGLPVERKQFDEFNRVECYDGIWCCASLLHVPLADLVDQMSNLEKGLKKDGIWYVSFKYGNGEREKDGRHFTDLNEKSLKKLILSIGEVVLDSIWTSDDARPDRSDKWINAILKKETA